MPEFDFKVLSVEPETLAVSPTLLVQLEITNKAQNELILSINLLTEFHFNPPAKSLYWTSVASVVPRFIGTTKPLVRLPCSQDSDLQVRKYLESLRRTVNLRGTINIRVICKNCRSEKESRVPKERAIMERHRLMEERCEVCGSLEYNVEETELEEKTTLQPSEPRIPFKLVFYGSAIYQASGSSTFNFYPFPQLPPKEATFMLPAKVWNSMMETHYGGARWVSLKRESFQKLHKYMEKERLASLDEALTIILERIQD